MREQRDTSYLEQKRQEVVEIRDCPYHEKTIKGYSQLAIY